MSNPINTQGNIAYVTNPGRQVQSLPATVNVADPAGMVDGAISQLSIDATGRLRVISTFPAGTTFPVLPSQTGDTIQSTARAVAPGAGVNVLTVAAPPAGTYEVWVSVGYDAGAPAAADINNMDLQRGGVAFATPLQVFSVLNNPNEKMYRITFSGAQNLTVNAIGAGTAGVGYSASVILKRVA